MSGTPTPSKQQLSLPAEVVHRVLGERLERVRQSRPGQGHRILHRLGVQDGAAADGLALDQDVPTVEHHAGSVLDLHDVGPRTVDEGDAGRDEDLGAEVGIPAGDARMTR